MGFNPSAALSLIGLKCVVWMEVSGGLSFIEREGLVLLVCSGGHVMLAVAHLSPVNKLRI